jgi:hypothetical protein
MAQRPERIAARIPRRPHPVPSWPAITRSIEMPTDIERSYLEQGYRLPEGLTWDMVDERRARWGIRPVMVPVAVGPGCLGWGVPVIDGKPLTHP